MDDSQSGSQMERVTVRLPSQMRRDLRLEAARRSKPDGTSYTEAELARLAIVRLLRSARRRA